MGDEPTKANDITEVLEESAEEAEGSPLSEKKHSSKKRVAIIVAACALVLVVGCGSVFAMSQGGSKDNSTADSPAQSTNAATSQKATDKKDTAEASEDAAKTPSATAEAQPATEDEQPAAEDAQSAASESRQSVDAAQIQTESVSSDSAVAHTHNWVEQTSTQWVPNIVTITDSAAWDESVPVYGTKECAICYTCGADITGNTAAHQKTHALAGEQGSYSIKDVQTVTGYETIHHDAATHTEDQGHEQTTVTGYVCSECGATQ